MNVETGLVAEENVDEFYFLAPGFEYYLIVEDNLISMANREYTFT